MIALARVDPLAMVVTKWETHSLQSLVYGDVNNAPKWFEYVLLYWLYWLSYD